MARSNLMQECPQLSSKSIEMVCADYLEGLKQARARYRCSGFFLLTLTLTVYQGVWRLCRAACRALMWGWQWEFLLLHTALYTGSQPTKNLCCFNLCLLFDGMLYSGWSRE